MGALLDRRADRDHRDPRRHASVVAANAWMNEPSGFTLDCAGEVVDVDPLGVIFNNAMPLQALAHDRRRVRRRRVPDRVGVRGRDAARPPRPLPPARLPHPVHGRSIATPIQMVVGDSLARWVYNNQPMKFAAIELVPKTSSDVPETLLRPPELGRRGDRRDPDPRARVDGCRIRATARRPSIKGSTRSRRTQRPTIRQVNVVHLAWDVMVGSARCCSLLRGLVRAIWLFRRDMPKSKWFLRIARLSPASLVGDRDGGGLGGHARSAASRGSSTTS